MTQPADLDLVKLWYPAFADLRDRLKMRIADSEHRTIVQWFVRMEGDRFDLMISEDRGTPDFYISLHGGRKTWPILTVLRELGQWNDPPGRINATKLAHVLEQNLESVLRHISQKSTS